MAFAGNNAGLPMNVDSGGPLDHNGNPIGPVNMPNLGGLIEWGQKAAAGLPAGPMPLSNPLNDPFMVMQANGLNTMTGTPMPQPQDPFGINSGAGYQSTGIQTAGGISQVSDPFGLLGGSSGTGTTGGTGGGGGLGWNNGTYTDPWAGGGIDPTIAMLQQTSPQLGWAGAYRSGGVNPLSTAQQAMISSQAGALADLLGTQYSSDRQLQGQLGVAGINQGTQLGVAGIQDQMNRYIQDQVLKGTLAQVDADKLRSQLGLQGTKYTADQNLAGIKDTNQANLGVAGIQGQAQLGSTAISSADDLLKAQAVTKLAEQLMGGGTLGGVGLPGGGTGTGTGGAGGTGTGASVGQVAGALDALGNPTRPPVIPPAAQIGPESLQKLIASRSADVVRANDSAQRNAMGQLGRRGFSAASPGFANMLAQQDMAENAGVSKAATDAELAAIGANAQNALGPAQLGAQLYGQQLSAASEIQKARELAKLQGQNQLQNTIFGSLLGALG